ncbi:MAG: SGNH/GDSL hydrolase family protein [Verrucomicrobiia bacterium]
MKNRIGWFARGCVGLALRATPISSRAGYGQSISAMVDAIVSFGAYPIVLTPFVMGNFLCDAWARRFSRDVIADCAGRADVCAIDAWSLLNRHPRSKMLLHDGLHLSRRGHEVLAPCLKAKLVEWIQVHMASSRQEEPGGVKSCK